MDVSPQNQLPKKNKSIYILVVALIIVLILGVAVYALTRPSTTAKPNIEITGLNITIAYAGLTNGYFGPTSQGGTQSIVTITAGEGLFEYFTMENGDSSSAHTINEISVQTSGFTIVSVSPSLPITISASGTTQITLTFSTPNTYYDGPLSITLTTDS